MLALILAAILAMHEPAVREGPALLDGPPGNGWVLLPDGTYTRPIRRK